MLITFISNQLPGTEMLVYNYALDDSLSIPLYTGQVHACNVNFGLRYFPHPYKHRKCEPLSLPPYPGLFHRYSYPPLIHLKHPLHPDQSLCSALHGRTVSLHWISLHLEG